MHEEPTRQQQTDHDVLIELRTEVRGMRVDMKDIRDNFQGRVAALENTALSAEERANLFRDVESLKMRVWFAMGGLAILTMMVIPLVVYIFNQQAVSSQAVTAGVEKALRDYEVTVQE